MRDHIGGILSQNQRKGGLVKAQNGLQYNPNFGGGTGTSNLFPNIGNFQTPPELQAQMNTFNTLYGGGANTDGFGGLEKSDPSKYERVPFESQYSGIQGILPYASSALNLGLGVAGLMNPSSLDASKYQFQPETMDTNINKMQMLTPEIQAHSTALHSVNNPLYKTMMHANFMPHLGKRSESIDFLQKKLERQNIDTRNKYTALNLVTQYGIDMKNIELGSLPWQHMGQAASDITSTAMQMGQNKGMEQLLYNMYPQYRKVG